MAKFPTYEEMGKKVAEEALDGFVYKGKTLREWIDILSSSEIPNKCEDAISRQAVLVGIEELKKSPWATDKRGNGFEYLIKEALDVVADLCVKKEPSVTPKQKMCFDGMTNGEVIGLLFPNAVIYHNRDFTLREMIFPDEWWNEPYKAESEVSE